MDRPCIVCQENCPVSPKAIFTREYFSTVRGGRFRLRAIAGQKLELMDGNLEPGKLATGDYYGVTTCNGRENRWPILANTKDSITLAESISPNDAPDLESYLSLQVRLQQPYVDPKLCIGCGICQHECPVNGKRAIRVTAENESRSPGRSMLLPPST
jgi:ferredoxin